MEWEPSERREDPAGAAGVPEKASEKLSLYGIQHPAGPWCGGNPWQAPEVEREWGGRERRSGAQGEDVETVETVLSRNLTKKGRGEVVRGSEGDSGSGRESLWGSGRLEPDDRLRGAGVGSDCFTGDSKHGGDVCGLWGQAAGVCIPAPPCTSRVTLGKSLNSSVPPFPLQNGNDSSPSLTGLCGS